MICQRCGNPNNPTHEYTITKQIPFGDEVKQKRNFCATCAEITKDAGFKLTGGKREAEPEASTEVSETEAEPTEKPARRRY